MTIDEAKDFALEACRSPLTIDIEAMRRSLSLWSITIEEYERLTEPSKDALQQFLVYLNCGDDGLVAKAKIVYWLEHMEEWPWPGHWHFVLHHNYPGKLLAEWTFDIIRYAGGRWDLRKVDAKPKWPQPPLRKWMFPYL